MHRHASAILLALSLVASTFAAGCIHNTQAKVEAPRYVQIKPPVAGEIPAYMAGSLYDRTVLSNNTPYSVSAFSMVGQLRGTGSCVAPPMVRAYMVKELAKHGVGDKLVPGWEHVQPNEILADPNYAVVRVEGLIPPGARKGDWFDVSVTALPGNPTRSLAHGVLFETDLKLNGADPEDPVGPINVFAVVKGPVLVNPAYALFDGPNPSKAARTSLRNGVVMYGGKIKQDRPIFLRLRDPQLSTARTIEERVRSFFNGDFSVAAAFDEGVVQLYMPPSFRGDWQHFCAVVQHLFLNTSPEFNGAKARRLAIEARKPNALLEDISLCWEGIGKDALPFVMPLVTEINPDISFAAARAAVFIGDNTGAAEQRLIEIANEPGNPYRLTAVATLGMLPASNEIDTKLRPLLESNEATVRIAAYKVLAQNHDISIQTRFVSHSENFCLDIVECEAPPLIYASRQGAPRIAIIGRLPHIHLPILYSAMDSRLTISSAPSENFVTMFYRDPVRTDPIKVLSQPDMAEIIARLGGDSTADEDHLSFSYGEVLAIVQSLCATGQVICDDNGRLLNAPFVLQDLPRVWSALREAPTTAAANPASADATSAGAVSAR